MINLQKICVIHTYLGNWPNWIRHFLLSCEANTSLHFLLVADHELPCAPPANVHLLRLSKAELSARIHQRLQIQNTLISAYKLCDFKPCYGALFKEYLEGFDFWAPADNDLIFGNLRNYLTVDVLRHFDIISFNRGFISGAFTLYRNTDYINTLYTRIHRYRALLEKPEYMGLDEKIHRNELQGFSWHKLMYYTRFVLQENRFFSPRKSWRYDFQWWYKKLRYSAEEALDLTEVVWQQQAAGVLRAHFADWLYSDAWFHRQGHSSWEVRWGSGGLAWQNHEPAGFHFLNSKKKTSFSVSLPSETGFIITEKGILPT